MKTDLNPQQEEAVLHTEGPLLVLAGAGSGKTKMLTCRIAYLVQEKKIEPSRILAVTFTNKAAKEMQERVARLLPSHLPFSQRPEIGTFHGVCLKILKRSLSWTPFEKEFGVYDDGEQLSLIKNLLKKQGYDEKSVPAKSIQGWINRVKCDALELDELPSGGGFLGRLSLDLPSFYQTYQKELFSQNMLDFGEILCLTNRLLKEHPDLLKAYQSHFQYVHVDEYQDTNRIQYLLLSRLVSRAFGGHENICVVGDEDQSIYAWRGANIRNILDFEKDYPSAKVIKLEQNYRSTQKIISAASALIASNAQRKAKKLWTQNEEGSALIRWELPNEREEAERVISEIQSLTTEGFSPHECAIFYRTNAQSRQFEEVLRREKIHYQIYGGLRFYDRKEIKDLLSYFKAILNPQDSISMKRIFNTPARGLGKSTFEILEQRAFQEGVSFWEAIQSSLQGSPEESGLGRSGWNRLQEFYQLMTHLQTLQAQFSLRGLYHEILKRTQYLESLQKEASEEALQRIDNLKEFETLLQEFEHAQQEVPPAQHLSLFLEQSSLDPPSESESLGEGGLSHPPVQLMTLHSSKGLEFPVVFLVGLEERLFPSVRGWDPATPENLEEERRLCYVGMTRARKRLYLTHVTIRHLWGQMNYQRPSRFLSEIPEHFFETPAALKVQTARVSTAPLTGWVGRGVIHPDYGTGIVKGLEGFGENEKVVIEFRGYPPKKFLARYVKPYLSHS